MNQLATLTARLSGQFPNRRPVLTLPPWAERAFHSMNASKAANMAR
jgi:hypothetical protein